MLAMLPGLARRRRRRAEAEAPPIEPTMVLCSTCGFAAMIAGPVTDWAQEANRTGSRVRLWITTPFVKVRHRCAVPRAA